MSLLKPGPGGVVTIIAPANYATGGIESQHQLGAVLRELGVDARMVYCKDGEIVKGGMHPEYARYWVPEAPGVVDDKQSVIILPQIWPEAVGVFKEARVGFWWLGINELARAEKAWKPGSLDGCVHLSQSYYAWDWLRSRDPERTVYMLHDYISPLSTEPLAPSSRRKVIAFNPVKGLEKTKKIIHRCIDRDLYLAWAPLMNLTRQQLSEQLAHVQLYIDFGVHLGVDRIPREAAQAGAAVITGVQGSARYHEDVSLPPGFKFDDDHLAENLDAIVDKIAECIYGDAVAIHDKFADYRQSVREGRSIMLREVMALFT